MLLLLAVKLCWGQNGTEVIVPLLMVLLHDRSNHKEFAVMLSICTTDNCDDISIAAAFIFPAMASVINQVQLKETNPCGTGDSQATSNVDSNTSSVGSSDTDVSSAGDPDEESPVLSAPDEQNRHLPQSLSYENFATDGKCSVPTLVTGAVGKNSRSLQEAFQRYRNTKLVGALFGGIQWSLS